MNPQALEQAVQTKSFLNPDQRRELNREIQSYEWAIHGRSMFDGEQVEISVNGYTPEPELQQEQLNRLTAMRDEHTPPELSGVERNYLHKRLRELETEITHTMPTHEMMERPIPANIDAHLAWEQHNIHHIVAWRNIRRALDPDNDEPHFTSVEILRTNTPPKGDPRKFWRGYDNVAWTAQQETMLADVDDSLYLAFLKLYSKRWSEKSIKKELNLSDGQYARAMERLNEVPEEDKGPDADVDTHAQAEEADEPDETFWLLDEMNRLGVSKYRLCRDAQISQGTLKKWVEAGAVDPKYRNIIERVMSKFRKQEQERAEETTEDTVEQTIEA